MALALPLSSLAVDGTATEPTAAAGSTLGLSRFTAVALLIMYIAFLAFQLKTHTHLYEVRCLCLRISLPVPADTRSRVEMVVLFVLEPKRVGHRAHC